MRVAGRVFSALSLSILIVSLASSGSPVAADHIDRSRNNVMHWNLAGRKMNQGSLGVANAYLGSVLNRSPAFPLAVSANEICFDQHQSMKNELVGNRDYRSEFIVAVSHPECAGPLTDSNQYGNAIFWRGGRETSHEFFYTANPDAEKRNMVCGVALFPRAAYCSTHLRPEDAPGTNPSSITAAQADSARDIANYMQSGAGAVPTLVMGDFNMLPVNRSFPLPRASNPAIQRWYNGYYYESDGCQSCADGTHPVSCCGVSFNEKLDYIWTRADRWYNFAHPAYEFHNPSYSDHELLQGYPSFR